jgi:hypothetical protein
MVKFKAGSKAHTTWDSGYDPFSDINYRYARDTRGVGMSGFFLPRGYFDSAVDSGDSRGISLVAAITLLIVVAVLLCLT